MRMTTSVRHTFHRPRRAHGLSVVELLIGVAIGLFILAGAAMVASNQVSHNKKLLLETQVQQDLRTAMDVIVRDIRRSGYYKSADALPATGAPLGTPSVYKPAGSTGSTDTLQYTYFQDNEGGERKDINVLTDADVKGFRLRTGVVEVQLSRGNWQALTDPSATKITAFDATPVESSDVLIPDCDTPAACPSKNACGLQRVIPRYIDLRMEGEAVHDSRVKRRLEARVRVRNDEVCL